MAQKTASPAHLVEGFHTDCRYFTGYKPCQFHRPCTECPHHDPIQTEVLLINLDALGDVLRTTAVLPPIRRRWPGARITWLTRARALPLIQHHPMVDTALPFNLESITALQARHFDVLLNVDKSAVAGGLAVQLSADDRRGFGVNGHGAIVPLNGEADYLYRTGLDDELKFRINQKSEPQMLCEAFGLPYHRDPYQLPLPAHLQNIGPRRAVGFNTGCSPLYPYKKLPLSTQEAAIRALSQQLVEPILLLGGPEDRERNQHLASRLGEMVEETPTNEGLLVGAAHVRRCDVVVSGDSLGMHMAIALERHVVVWFGVTCPQEIEVYGRGIKLLSAVQCAPCWKRNCKQEIKCFDRVSPEWIVSAVQECLHARKNEAVLDSVQGADWWRPAKTTGHLPKRP